MRPESMTVAVRPRDPYEAADLGVSLVQANAGIVYRCWFAVLLPVLAIGVALNHLTGDAIAIGLIWWLKPLFDYVVLWLLSRTLFGVKPRLRDVLRAMPGFLRQGLPGALTVRRLSMSRAYLLPVRLLEGQSGSALNARISLLRRNATAKARILFQLFALFEAALTIGLLMQIKWFAGSGFDAGQFMHFLTAAPDTWQHDIVVVLYALAVSVVEPLYVAAGFMLYLNRRTVLEAWDVEIALRGLAARLEARRAA